MTHSQSSLALGEKKNGNSTMMESNESKATIGNNNNAKQCTLNKHNILHMNDNDGDNNNKERLSATLVNQYQMKITQPFNCCAHRFN